MPHSDTRTLRSTVVFLAALLCLIAVPAAPQNSAPKPSPEVQALLDKGEEARKAFRWEEALQFFGEAGQKGRQSGDRAGEGRALHCIGNVYLVTGQPTQALEYYEKALALRKASGDRGGEAATLTSIGAVHWGTGQPRQALEYYQQALVIRQAIGDRGGEAATLTNIGMVYALTGQPTEALKCYLQALPIGRAAGDRQFEATTLGSIGSVYRDTGNPKRALEYYRQALPIFRATRDRRGEAATLNAIGAANWDTRQPQSALDHFQLALSIRKTIGDGRGEAETLTNIGNVYLVTGEPKKALEYYQRALPTYKSIRNRGGEAESLTQIGNVYSGAGRPKEALDYYQQALLIHRETGNRQFEAATLDGVGAVYLATGQLQKALERYQQALSIRKAIGDKGGEAGTLANIGNVYSDVGQPNQALQYYRQALFMHRETGNRQFEANTLGNIGNVYSRTGRPKNALEYYERALSIFRAIRDRGGEAQTLSNIGGGYADVGQPRKALRYYQQALPLHRAAGDGEAEANTLYRFGFFFSRAGRPTRALRYYQQALRIDRDIGNRAGEANVLGAVAVTEQRRGHVAQAGKSLEAAAHLLESLRESLGGMSKAKTSFLASGLFIYHRYIALLLRRGRTAQAFELAQKTKARALLDLLYDGRVEIGSALTAEERTQERELRQRADQLNGRMVAEGVRNEVGSKKRFLAFKQQLTQAESDLQTLEDSLYARHPGLAQKRAARTVTLQDVGRFLPSDTALLEYAVVRASDRPRVDRTILFVVTASGGRAKVSAFSLTVTGERLTKEVDALRAVCADPRKDFRGQARRMYRLLIAPAARKLAGKKRLILCPDGPLWDAPFAALLAPGYATASASRRQPDAKDKMLDTRYSMLDGKHRLSRVGISNPTSRILRPESSIQYPASSIRHRASSVRHPASCISPPRFLIERFEIDYAYSATGAQAALLARADRKRAKSTGSMLVMANPDFGAEKRFGDNPQLAGQRPLDAPGRPLDAPGRPLDSPGRPLDAPGRPLDAPARPLDAPGRPIEAPARALVAAAREVCVPRGGRIVALPGTQREAEMLKRDFPGAAIYTGQEAQESVVKREAGKYRYLHFATHGFFNDAAPLLSSIVLAAPNGEEQGAKSEERWTNASTEPRAQQAADPKSAPPQPRTPNTDEEDGFLTAREIFDMNLSAEMVVLSACNSARGEKRSGEGVVGLTWALFVAGAPTQVLSQWSVDDTSTAALMERFYGGVTRGQAKGAALWAAELALLRDGRHAHPYYWAPFVLMGDWRK